jgi:hypothetical protein
MAKPQPPGEPGYDPDRWFQHVVNVGLGLARQVGTGLPLVNSLVGAFRGVARSILGAAASILGQGIRAAMQWNSAQGDHIVNVDDLPLAPKGFFGPEEVQRVVGIQDVPGTDERTGDTVYHQQRINWPEDWSKDAIEEVIEAVADENADLYPGDYWDVDKQQKAHMIWIGKRY